MFRSTQAIAILSGSLLVAGCQTSAAKFARLNDAIKVPAAVPELQRAQEQLTAGRQALGERSYAAAIKAFRAASIEPALQPAAQNGLGVAFAGIGRTDLAEQHFRKAISLDPANAKYEENLARLYREKLAADQLRRSRTEAHRRALAARNLAETKRRFANGISVMAPANRIVRSDDGTVSIRSVHLDPPASLATLRQEALVARPAAAGQVDPVFQPAVITAAGLRPEHVRPGANLAVAAPSKPIIADTPAAPVRTETVVAQAAVVTAPGLRSANALLISSPGLRPGAAVALVEKARAPAVTIDQPAKIVVQRASLASLATGAIRTTGRLDAPTEVSSSMTASTSTHDRPAVQLASNHGIGTALLGPISARKSILGMDAGVAHTDSALVDLP